MSIEDAMAQRPHVALFSAEVFQHRMGASICRGGHHRRRQQQRLAHVGPHKLVVPEVNGEVLERLVMPIPIAPPCNL